MNGKIGSATLEIHFWYSSSFMMRKAEVSLAIYKTPLAKEDVIFRFPAASQNKILPKNIT